MSKKKLNDNFIIIQKGRNLSARTIKQIIEIWQTAFPENETIRPYKPKSFANDTFFIVYSPEKKILSVGTLQSVKINFLGKSYNIQGIGGVVSVIKGRGYGKMLMQEIRMYLHNKRQAGVGFCSKKNTPFYEKCGFKIAKNLVKRFVYKNPEGKLIMDKGDDDVLYLRGRNKFIEKVLAHPKEKVLIPCPHW